MNGDVKRKINRVREYRAFGELAKTKISSRVIHGWLGVIRLQVRNIRLQSESLANDARRKKKVEFERV